MAELYDITNSLDDLNLEDRVFRYGDSEVSDSDVYIKVKTLQDEIRAGVGILSLFASASECGPDGKTLNGPQSVFYQGHQIGINTHGDHTPEEFLRIQDETIDKGQRHLAMAGVKMVLARTAGSKDRPANRVANANDFRARKMGEGVQTPALIPPIQVMLPEQQAQDASRFQFSAGAKKVIT